MRTYRGLGIGTIAMQFIVQKKGPQSTFCWTDLERMQKQKGDDEKAFHRKCQPYQDLHNFKLLKFFNDHEK